MTRRKLGNTDIETFNSEVDYILHRPEIYIGSVQPITQNMYYIDQTEIKNKNVTYIPGLFKIFDEVISNSVDEAIRLKDQQKTKIDTKIDDGVITIKDNGQGIPSSLDEETGQYVPTVVFSSLRTGANFDDDKDDELLGRNGVGVSLTNIFSSWFSVTTKMEGYKQFQQTFRNNLKETGKPVLKDVKKSSHTEVTFRPNYEYFQRNGEFSMEDWNWLIHKRVSDLALCFPEIDFTFNGKKIQINKLKALNGSIVTESEKCRIAVFPSKEGIDTNGGTGQISFVNGVETSAGGNHVTYITNRIAEHVREYVRKKHKIDIKPKEITNNIFLLCSVRIRRPNFTSQTKNYLSTPAKDFSERIDEALTNRFLNAVAKNETILESILEIHRLRSEQKERQKLKELNKSKKKTKIPKLIEAQSSEKEKNILMICEGDSAISELINVRNPHVAGIPIRGRLLNIYDKTPIEVAQNSELYNLMQAIGLKIGKRATDINYGKIGFLTDMDPDGNAITGLLINFFYKFWPELFDQGKMVRVLSPLFTAEKGQDILRFYSKNEYEEWAKQNNTDSSWKVKYYKGLGSLGSKEYELILNEPEYIELQVTENTGKMIELVYSPDTSKRKEWLQEEVK